MSSFPQQKKNITRKTEKLEILFHSKEKENKLTEAITNKVYKLDLIDQIYF